MTGEGVREEGREEGERERGKGERERAIEEGRGSEECQRLDELSPVETYLIHSFSDYSL